MEVVKNDFPSTESMLKTIDEVRDMILCGEITGFAITAICLCGQSYQTKSVWWAQKLALLGAIETHKAAIMTELNSEKIASELDKL